MLYLQLLERMSVIALAAYMYSRTPTFKNMIKDDLDLKDKLIKILFFSIVSILGTYLGLEVMPYAIANTRPIGAITAGLVGGPVIGSIVGAIAGVHRYSLGGFTALACSISTVIEGLIGGLFKRLFKNQEFSLLAAILASIIAEIIQVAMILLLAKPFETALNLERIIAFPMIFINLLGVIVFISIMKNVKEEYKKVGAIQVQKALAITQKALIYMRRGFNEETAQKIAEIIYHIGNTQGVFIGDKNNLLAFCGDRIDGRILKVKLEEFYKDPQCMILKYEQDNKSNIFFCVPITIHESQLEGVLGLRVLHEKEIDRYFIIFCKELSSLLSTQIELHKLSKLAQGVQTAELKALRAQIQPHFLFNALNTIACFCRTDPSKARDLIIDLSNYFRKTLKREEDFITVKEELEFVQSYLNIEQARFGDRLKVEFDIPSEVYDCKMPAFMIQPLVENSIKHGIGKKIEGGSVNINAVKNDEVVNFKIIDTGVGIKDNPHEKLNEDGTGIGLRNVNNRLKILYGTEYGLYIDSRDEEGTKVSFSIPFRR